MQNSSKIVSRVAFIGLALSAFVFVGCESIPPTPATTVACSNALSPKAKLPPVVTEDLSYRPIFDISGTAASGQGVADNDKLSKVGNAFPPCVFVDPEIFKGLSPMQSLALREAIVAVCKSTEADFLVAPRWEFKVTSDGRDFTTVSCTVTGYPAKITGFEKIDDWQQKLAAKDAEIEALKTSKDAEIEAVKIAKDVEIAALKKAWADERTREKSARVYLELMKEYDVKTMDDVRRLRAMMGEVLPVDPLAGTTSLTAGEIKVGCASDKLHLDVPVSTEVPALKVELKGGNSAKPAAAK